MGELRQSSGAACGYLLANDGSGLHSAADLYSFLVSEENRPEEFNRAAHVAARMKTA